jgi:putative ABC transport system permease protein
VGSPVAAALITAATLPAEPGGSDARPSRRWLALGATLGAGLALVTPTLVHVASKVAGRLPLAARLAARDADRHRMRTAPAIAGVMAGVAAVTALGIGSFSDNRDRRAESLMYQFPIGAVTVFGESATALETAVRVGATNGVAIVPLGTPAEDEYVSVEYARDSDVSGIQYDNARFEVVIADADTVQGWGVSLTPEAIAALESGRAVVGPTVAVRDGRVEATLEPVHAEDGGPGTPLVMPAVSADIGGEPVPTGVRSQLARVVIPPDLARSLGVESEATSAVVDRRDPRPTDEQAAELEGLPGVDVEVQQEARFASYRPMFTLLTLLGVGVVGLATATAVALARLDGREDAATLVSVGARPSTARWTAAAAALLIGGVGSLLGLLVGLLPGVRAATSMTGGYGESFVAIPWALLATVGVAIPLVVAGIAFVTAPVRAEQASSNLR